MKFAASILIAAATAVSAIETENGKVVGPPNRRAQTLVYNETVSGLAPPYTINMHNVFDAVQPVDFPVFWYVGKSGGVTFARIIAECLKATQISSKGDSTNTLIPVAPPASVIVHQDDQGKYYNINPNTQAGMDLIASENVITGGSADILITPRLVESGALFGGGAPHARMMVMLRHPVKREIDEFYWRQGAIWDPNFDVQLATMGIDTFIQTNKLIDNFVVRSLNDNLPLTIQVTDEHVTIAKNILREKFVVGIFEWFDSSIERFEKYLGWDTKYNVNDAAVSQCQADVIADGGHFGITPPIEPGSDTWSKIVIRTWADLELYTYAKHLFGEQGLIVP